jgi:hypothetical protein
VGELVSSQDRVALLRVVEAWEALPGGRHYSPREVEEWLRNKMTPAINEARDVLNIPHPTLRK